MEAAIIHGIKYLLRFLKLVLLATAKMMVVMIQPVIPFSLPEIRLIMSLIRLRRLLLISSETGLKLPAHPARLDMLTLIG